MNPVTPERILSVAQNFMECRILLTGAELNLFTLLTPVPVSAGEVAKRLGADLRAVTILLEALTAMGLLDKRRGEFQCSPSISPFLSADSPDSVLPLVLHMARVWERWSSLTGIVRGSQAPEMPTAQLDRDALRAFIGAMHVIAARLAPRIVAAVRPESSRTLLDVGAASGTYTLAFLQVVPEMRATLFDQPEVIEMARQRLSEAGVLDRVALAPGDFYRDEFPRGHDLAFVSAIIHQNSPGQNLDLFSKVFRSLDPGGRIVIRDHVMNPERTTPREGAVFAVNMLVSSAGGNTYTYDEIKEALTQAGFIGIRLVQTGEHMDGLVEAYKPSSKVKTY